MVFCASIWWLVFHVTQSDSFSFAAGHPDFKGSLGLVLIVGRNMNMYLLLLWEQLTGSVPLDAILLLGLQNQH